MAARAPRPDSVVVPVVCAVLLLGRRRRHRPVRRPVRPRCRRDRPRRALARPVPARPLEPVGHRLGDPLADPRAARRARHARRRDARARRRLVPGRVPQPARRPVPARDRGRRRARRDARDRLRARHRRRLRPRAARRVPRRRARRRRRLRARQLGRPQPRGADPRGRHDRVLPHLDPDVHPAAALGVAGGGLQLDPRQPRHVRLARGLARRAVHPRQRGRDPAPSPRARRA